MFNDRAKPRDRWYELGSEVQRETQNASASADSRKVREDPRADLKCGCGHDSGVIPDRHHFVWDCPGWTVPNTGATPTCQAEEVLFLLTVNIANAMPIDKDTQPDPGLSSHYAILNAAGLNNMLTGADGGSDHPGLSKDVDKIKVESLRRASLAVAVKVKPCDYSDELNEGIASWGGLAPGIDQGIFVAELYAVVQAVTAAKEAQVSITLIVDNSSVVDVIADILAGRTSLPTQCYRTVAAPRADISLGVVTSAGWIPSHDKKMSTWSPPTGNNLATWRALNRAADERCGT